MKCSQQAGSNWFMTHFKMVLYFLTYLFMMLSWGQEHPVVHDILIFMNISCSQRFMISSWGLQFMRLWTFSLFMKVHLFMNIVVNKIWPFMKVHLSCTWTIDEFSWMFNYSWKFLTWWTHFFDEFSWIFNYSWKFLTWWTHFIDEFSWIV
jgi:hypothetical protein